MFKIFKKIANHHYSITYKKPETFKNNEYADSKLVTVRPISGAEISEYDIESKIKNRNYKFEKNCIKPFSKVKRKSTNFPGISVIWVEKRYRDSVYIVNDDELTEKSILESNDIFYIKSPDGEMAIWPYLKEDKRSRWYSSDSEQVFFDNVGSKLIAIFGMAEQQAIDSFAPGIMEIIGEMDEHIKKASYFEKETIIKEIGKFLNDVYKTIESMNGFKDKSYLTIDELIDIKNDEDRKKREDEIAKEKARKDEQQNFIDQIKSRRSLLKDFNRPLGEAVSLLQSSLNDD